MRIPESVMLKCCTDVPRLGLCCSCVRVILPRLGVLACCSPTVPDLPPDLREGFLSQLDQCKSPAVKKVEPLRLRRCVCAS